MNTEQEIEMRNAIAKEILKPYIEKYEKEWKERELKDEEAIFFQSKENTIDIDLKTTWEELE